MLGIIKSAIITIAISFISGVLLDRYKNSAPKILCNMKRSSKVRGRNKGIKAYILTVKNASKKTIHNLNINLQARYKDLKINNAKITNGLKFEIASEDNNYNVSIPFLSKDDEFSVKLFVEDTNEGKNKPIVTLRSPEDFKKINSNGDKGVEDLLQNTKAIFLDKRVIAIAVVVFLVCGGITMSKYFLKDNKETQSTLNENNNKSLNDNTKDSANTTKNSSTSNDKSRSQEKQDSTKKNSNVDNNKSNSSSSTNANNSKEVDSKKSTVKENNVESSSENNTSKNNSTNSVKDEENKSNLNSNLNSNGSNEGKTSTDEKSDGESSKSSVSGTTKESN